MRTPPRNTGFQHPIPSEITPKAIYEDRRQMLKRMAGGAAGAAMAAWARREALAPQARTAIVLGAGIAGVTAAYLLSKEGRSVAILDDGPIGGGETSRTTAHLASAQDDRFTFLERHHGAAGTKLAAQSHAAAIDRIESICNSESIDCDFRRVDGYLFNPPDGDPKFLEQEQEAAQRAGLLDATLIPRAPLSCFDTGPALRFPRQGQFDPLRYVRGLAAVLTKQGGQIYTGVHALMQHFDEVAHGLLGRAGADQELVPEMQIIGNRDVQSITAAAKRRGRAYPAKRQYGSFRGACPAFNDHGTLRQIDRKVSAQCSDKGFGEQLDRSEASVIRCGKQSTAFGIGCIGGYADDCAERAQPPLAHTRPHGIGQIIASSSDVAQDPAVEGPDHPHGSRSSIQHGPDSGACGHQFSAIRLPREAAQRRLVEQDASAGRYDAGVRGAKIDREIRLAHGLKQSLHLTRLAVAAWDVSRRRLGRICMACRPTPPHPKHCVDPHNGAARLGANFRDDRYWIGGV